MSTTYKFAELVGRIGIALIFLLSSVNKIGHYSGTQGYMESMGVPGALLPLVILVEFCGAIALMVGWQTRIAAFLLAGFTLLAALFFHTNFSDQIQMIMFLKNISITGGLLVVFGMGAGAISLDAKRAA